MSRPVPAGPPSAPVAQRLAVRYAKRGRMRFASHRDVARAIERAVRKAGLPVAFSSGFSPHPKISYPGGAPTGAASEAEYLEIALTGSRAPAEVRNLLDAALPDGIDVIEVTTLDAERGGMRLEASHWQAVLPGVAPATAQAAAQAFLAAPVAEVERLTTKGIRRFDARGAVITLELDRRAMEDQDAGCAILRMVVRQMTPAVRPDDILAALRNASALAPSSPPLVTRLAQGPLGAGAAASGTGMPGVSGTAESGPPRPTAQVPQPTGRGAAQAHEKATCLEAGDARAACAAPVSAYEQFPRGAEDPESDLGAREPDGRDCPDARDGATQRRIRT
ncbi:MAG TPA: TIGR03936 family radical SAM-associated protein [Streptosporangiaceae bacterium]|nr:TIGR03936 family radical SAM-associated protein [Streptosporangiaceae bacterium]